MQNQVTPAVSQADTWVCTFCQVSSDHRRMGIGGAGRIVICDECVATCAEALGCALVPLNEMPAIHAARRLVTRDLDHLIAIATQARQELGIA